MKSCLNIIENKLITSGNRRFRLPVSLIVLYAVNMKIYLCHKKNRDLYEEFNTMI